MTRVTDTVERIGINRPQIHVEIEVEHPDDATALRTVQEIREAVSGAIERSVTGAGGTEDADADGGEDDPDRPPRDADRDGPPRCYNCGAGLTEEWWDANQRAKDRGKHPADCLVCGENPSRPVGDGSGDASGSTGGSGRTPPTLWQPRDSRAGGE